MTNQAWAEGDLLTPDNMNNRMTGAVTRKVYAAQWASGTGTTQINNAFVNAAANGFDTVFLDASMVPYNGALVTFNSSLHVIREGQGDYSEYDIVAYGASAVGSWASDAAFTAAIAAAPAGATIRIPPGAFTITASVAPPTGKNLRFKGQFNDTGAFGSVGSIINGNFNNWLLDINGGQAGSFGEGVEVSGIKFVQQSTGTSAGCVRVQGVMNAVVERVFCQTSNHGISLPNNCFACKITNCDVVGSPLTTTSIGIFVGAHTQVDTVSVVGFGYGVMLGVDGGGYCTFSTLRCELNHVGFVAGLAPDGTTPVQVGDFTLTGSSFESNYTQVWLRQCSSFFVSSLSILNDGFGYEQYGIRVDDCYVGTVAHIALGGSTYSVGGIVFDVGAGRGQLTFVNCVGGASGWTIPTSLDGYVEFVNCDIGKQIPTLTVNSATPSIRVSSARMRGVPQFWRTANTSITTITQFSDGLQGNPIAILGGDANTVIVHGTNIFLKAGANLSLSSGSVVQLVQFIAGRWDEI